MLLALSYVYSAASLCNEIELRDRERSSTGSQTFVREGGETHSSLNVNKRTLSLFSMAYINVDTDLRESALPFNKI